MTESEVLWFASREKVDCGLKSPVEVSVSVDVFGYIDTTVETYSGELCYLHFFNDRRTRVVYFTKRGA